MGTDESFMRRAVQLSQVAMEEGNFPFGAVLVCDGDIVEEATNSTATLGGDVTAHAEMMLVRYMCGQVGGRGLTVPPDKRRSCTVYTSCEPCVMCAGALFWSGVGRIVFGCESRKLEEIAGPGGFDLPLADLYGQGRVACRAREIEICGPLLEEEALSVHRRFWSSRKRGAALPPVGTAKKPRIGSFVPRDANVDAGEADAAVEREVLLEHSLRCRPVVAASEGQVPVIDLAQPDEVCATAMWDAARDVGFFTVVNHGIPSDAVDAAFEASAAFFRQARAEKEAQSPFARELNSGYEFMTQVRPSTGTADQKESLQITARAGAMDGRWPATPSGFEEVATSFSSAAHALGQRILDLLEAKACPHLQPGTLSGAHHLWGDDGQCTLRMLHYPPVDLADVPPNYWRAGPHTDWCCVTLLFQQPGNEGLECAANPRASGSDGGAGWLKVDPVLGGIAVNIGDMLSRWSSDRLLSNLHRVRMPTAAEASPPRSRYSIAFFMQADKRAQIESRHGTITAGEYILGRIRSNFAAPAKA